MRSRASSGLTQPTQSRRILRQSDGVCNPSGRFEALCRAPGRQQCGRLPVPTSSSIHPNWSTEAWTIMASVAPWNGFLGCWVRIESVALCLRRYAQVRSSGGRCREASSALMIEADLEHAYRATHYVVHPPAGSGQVGDGVPIVLNIDRPSPDLGALHRQRGVDCSCFITACNPLSQRLDEPSNLVRQVDLAAELHRRSLAFLPGEGRHPSNGWPPEASYLVLGLALEASKNLGRHYKQNAIVWAGADAVPRLVVLT